MRERAAAILGELQTTPASQRELFRYYEHCKIRLDGHRVVFWSKDKAEGEACAIPFCNIAFLLLGPGTSISSDAMELLAASNVVVGFTGGSGTPLNAGVEPIVFASGMSEYRPTEYMQGWASWWFDEKRRTEKARALLTYRAELIENIWTGKRMIDLFRASGLAAPSPSAFFASVPGVAKKAGPFGAGGKITAKEYAAKVFSANNVSGLFGQEGVHVDSLYRYFAQHASVRFDGRDHEAREGVNSLLTYGNYIAYGLAATALHGLGISFAFPVMHGKTRRGALVFDVADPVKDAVIVPLAFLAEKNGLPQNEYRLMVKTFLEDVGMLSEIMKKLKCLATI